jgi:circadian clock protein KaiC
VNDKQVMSIAHGALLLEQQSPVYGKERRRMRVAKMRGRPYRGGYHDYIIERGGVRVFPRLVAAAHREGGERPVSRVTSGNADLDTLLAGGLVRGTSTLVAGPPGSGKSSLMAMVAASAAGRGERAVLYLFDENPNTFITRSHALGLDLQGHIASGKLALHQVDPAELSPGEFVDRVYQEVEAGARLIALDSLNGYLNAMPEEKFLVVLLHELLTYLAQHSVLTFLVAPQHGFVGPLASNIDVSYLADTVILTRYFEAGGAVHNALSIMKQRSASHEKTIREFSIGTGGIHVGPPLAQFHGVLTGVPRYTGMASELLADPHHDES